MTYLLDDPERGRNLLITETNLVTEMERALAEAATHLLKTIRQAYDEGQDLEITLAEAEEEIRGYGADLPPAAQA